MEGVEEVRATIKRLSQRTYVWADFTTQPIGDEDGMAHLTLTPPAAFLPSPGEPSIPFTSWMRMFENFMLAVNDDVLSDAGSTHCLYTAKGLKGSVYSIPSQLMGTRTLLPSLH